MNLEATVDAPLMADLNVEERHGVHGVRYIRVTDALPAYPDNITVNLDRWASAAPERTFLAARGADGAWRTLTYAETHRRVRGLAQYLLGRDLSPDRPIVALSGNDIELALLSLAAMYVGIPIAPVSPAYSLLSADHAKLKYLFGLVTPGLVYVSDPTRFAKALEAVMTPDIALMTGAEAPRGAKAFADAVSTAPTGAVETARTATGPDTIAKFLFTSGTTGMPKAVINTQRMLCANQAMIASVWKFFTQEPPVMVDWLPWNHTAGGNHNFGIALTHGGTFHIDEGKPTPEGIGNTVRNLKDAPPTFYATVPRGFEALIHAMEHDAELKTAFFSRCKVLQYAGAGLSQKVWDTLDRYSRVVTGQPMLMVTGYGSTETAPFAFATTRRVDRSGHVGLPAPGLEVKLVPSDDKLELRLRGPSVTPGYWRDPERTAAAFDDEGYYMIGDALAYADPDDARAGFLFDGRIAEDFKLSSGTWVDCAGVRARVMAEAGPIVRDIVLAGLDRPYLTALIFPDPVACRRVAGGNDDVAHPAVRAAFQKALDTLAAEATGSSNRIMRAIVLAEPPSIDAHEVTDKGSINARAVAKARAGLIDDLYRDPAPDHVIVAGN